MPLRPELPSIQTVVKFYRNPKRSPDNKVITRTLLKIGLVDRQWQEEALVQGWRQPQPGEFWVVDVVDEIYPDEVGGCFLLRPRWPVDSIVPAVPGLFKERYYGKLLVLEHVHPEVPWVLSISLKRALRWRAYAIIVRTDVPPPDEETPPNSP